MSRVLSLLLAMLAGSAAGAAAAEDICVVCTAPEATYRCAVAEADMAAAVRGGDRVLKYLCATELARQGGHEKCRARRQAADVCGGLTRVVSIRAHLETAAPEPPTAAAAGAERTHSEADDGPPRTMLELARRTAGASQEQLDKTNEAVKGSARSAGEKLGQAGAAVGGALEKSWRCVTSLFQEC